MHQQQRKKRKQVLKHCERAVKLKVAATTATAYNQLQYVSISHFVAKFPGAIKGRIF